MEELKADFDVLSRPDGSVLLSEGETTVIAGVYGPVEVMLKKLSIDKAAVECFYRPKAGLPGVEDRFNENLIRNIVETSIAAAMHPRSAILIAIQEMHNEGKLMSCAINAACLACLSSGIDMKFMFGAVTVFLNEEGEVTLSSTSGSKFVFVYESCEGRVLASHTEGCFSEKQYEEAVNLGRDQVGVVFRFFKKSLTAL